MSDRRITITLTETARRLIARDGYDPIYGARPLRRYLQRQIETKLARAMIAGEVGDGTAVTVDEHDGILVFQYS